MSISQKFKIHQKKFISSIAIVLAIPLLLLTYSYYVISPYRQYILSDKSTLSTKVGLVLGAGINNKGKPYKELQARLDIAAMALKDGVVEKLILSGDNRFDNYDEPTAMKNYLVQSKNVPINKLVMDFAGRSTYESCARTSKVFGVKKVIIFSARSHLPRAIYLCRHQGMEAYGIASNIEANNSTRRELLARVKAIINVYIIAPNTVLGPRIDI